MRTMSPSWINLKDLVPRTSNNLDLLRPWKVEIHTQNWMTLSMGSTMVTNSLMSTVAFGFKDATSQSEEDREHGRALFLFGRLSCSFLHPLSFSALASPCPYL